MYFGPQWRLADQCALELVANCIDQFLVGEVTHFELKAEGREIRISDDGPGLPFDEPSLHPDVPPGTSTATDYFIRPHFEPSRHGHAPHVHLRALGVGLAVVAAVCDRLSVQSWRNGRCWRQEFAAAVPQDAPEVICTGAGRGTAMHLEISPEMCGSWKLRRGVVRQALFHAVHLFPGLALNCNGERFHAPGGLLDLAHIYAPNAEHRAFDKVIQARVADAEVELEMVAICERHARRCVTRSWMNGSETPEHGTHVDGVRAAFHGQPWKPATLLVHAIMWNPAFAAPVRSKVCNRGLRSRIARLLRPVVLETARHWTLP